MKATSIAKPYAKALFELSEESNSTAKTVEELQLYLQMKEESTELEKVFSSHHLTVPEKLDLFKILQEKVQLSELLSKFITLLLQKNRYDLLSQIVREFSLLADKKAGVLRGTVTTAEDISESQVKDLEAAFGKKFKQKIFLTPKTERTLLGGLVVEIQGLTFDGSLKTALNTIKSGLERQSL